MRTSKRIMDMINASRQRLASPPIDPEYAAILREDIKDLEYELEYARRMEMFEHALKTIKEWDWQETEDRDPVEELNKYLANFVY